MGPRQEIFEVAGHDYYIIQCSIRELEIVPTVFIHIYVFKKFIKNTSVVTRFKLRVEQIMLVKKIVISKQNTKQVN